jgi:methylenetetrahydrofolate reductase (NADPH)
MQLIRTGLFERHGIRRIGVAGHPEGSPDIPAHVLADALREKNEYAASTGTDMYLITQFCFEAQPIVAWDMWLQAEGNTLPVYIGVPGLATIKTLLGHAKACGVGSSMRVLTRTPVTKLMATKSPGRLLADLTAHVAYTPNTCIAGVHMYPLGGLGRTAKWTHAVVDGEFEVQPGGDRIRVTAAVD